ncbi:MAG: phosphoenolpyruvate synthase, partial [Methanocellales archaeon]|nr:phosphoenolpyruvate synthase [Methanocellales archaeon]
MVIVWLEEVRSKDVALVGGKGASLGEMINEELPVPRGFAVTAHAFRQFLDNTGIAKSLFESLEIDVDDSEALKNAAKKAKSLILNAEMPSEMRTAILDAYDKLCERESETVFVAVRSSATAEDLPNASFAGQQETFLNIRGGKAVLEAVKKCWVSLYGARAIFYRAKQGFEHEHVNIAVIIQKMVDADKAGVLFTSHPTSGEPTTIIEAGWGLGEAVVSGSMSPDNYVVDRRTKKIVQRHIATKNLMHVKDKDTGKTVQKKVPDDMMDKTVLTDGEVMKLTELGEIVENHYGTPQDVEWAIADGKIYMLQSRPITTIQIKDKEIKSGKVGELILEGIGASPGLAYGNVEIVSKLDELDRVGKGDILVTQMTTPDMVTAMKRAVGVITDEGGLTCHAAIVSRELGTPCIVGTKKGTKVLKDVKVVTIDGEKGHVYKGRLEQAIVKEEVAAPVARARQVTVTEVKVNISIPEAAEKAAATGADGVGLLRIEHMILG